MRKAWLMAVLAAGVWSAAGAGTENLVKNPGFEETDAPGTTMAWSDRKPVYRFIDGCGRMGSRGLAFDNNDPKFYSFPTQPIAFEPGACYEFEVWVRTEALEGEESGASICMEWYGADGKWLGGAYTEGVRGTSEGWVRVKGSGRAIPEKAARVVVAPYVRRGMTGKAWFDDMRVSRYYPPLASTVSASCYRHVAASGPVTFSAALGLKHSGIKADECAALFVFKDKSGATLKKLKPEILEEARAQITLDATELPIGESRVHFEISARDAAAKGTASTFFRRVERLPERKAYIDAHRRLIADGQPFFPLGMYWSGIKEPDLEVYAKGPFNCLMPYGSPSTNQMDLCHAHGLKVLYSIKDLYHGTRWAPKHIKTAEDETAAIKRTVELHRHHPALLAWYINDELPIEMNDRLAARQRLMEELDPDHPTWVVLYQYDQVGRYMDTFDVIGTDPYPIPKEPVGTALEWTRVTRDLSHNSRALWQVPQVFDWGAYRKGVEQEKARAPTLAEMRAMAWQCIAAGANGLVFYSFFDLQKMNERNPFERRWSEVCEMAAEIKRFMPILLSIEPVPSVKVEAPVSVETRLWRHAGSVYLLAVNGADEPVEAKAQVAGGFKSVVPQFGPAPDNDGNGGLTFKLTPLEPVLVRMVY
ncbi:MAG: hypothetical protein PHU80_00260 [Kiritimatiellae bacterium]|nr:hypothetical protein [Kiritimatiellia bacterium]